MKYIWEPNKVKQIRSAIRKIRAQKIDDMIQNPPTTDLNDIIDQTVSIKEENILITGNPKQGLKLKIHKSHLKHTIDPKPVNKYEISEMPPQERQHRKRMSEFLSHVDRRIRIATKIQQLRDK